MVLGLLYQLKVFWQLYLIKLLSFLTGLGYLSCSTWHIQCFWQSLVSWSFFTNLGLIEFWIRYFFNCYLATPQPTLAHYWRNSLTHPLLITVFSHIQPKDHEEPQNKVVSLSPDERIVGFEPRTFWFWLQHLNPLRHFPHLTLFQLSSLTDGFKWFWMKSLHKNNQLILELLKASFLVLPFSYYTLMTFLVILSIILLSMMMILLSTLCVIRYVICGNN